MITAADFLKWAQVLGYKPGGGGGGGVTPTQVQQSAFNVGTDTGVADAYVVALSPAVTSLTDGLLVSFTPVNQSTAQNPTLDVGTGPIPISLIGFNSLVPNDMASAQVAFLQYNLAANQFFLLTPLISYIDLTGIQGNSYISSADQGSVNALEANPVIQHLYGSGSFFIITGVDFTNTGPSTLSVAGTPLPIVLPDGSALVGGEIIAGQSYLFFNVQPALGWVLLNSSLSSSAPNPAPSYSFVSGSPPTYSPEIMTVWQGGSYANGAYLPNKLLGTLNINAQALSANGSFIQDVLTLDLGNLQVLMQGLGVTFNGVAITNWTNLTTLTANSLTTINGNWLGTWPALTTITMSNLISICGDFDPVMASITSFPLPSLQSIGGILSGSFNGITGAFTAPNLVSTAADISISAPNCTSFSFPSLESVGGQFKPSSTKATSISAPVLTTVGSPNTNGNFNFAAAACTSINFNSLVTAWGGIGATIASVTNITFPSLVNCNGPLSIVGSAATTFSFPVMTTITGAFTGTTLSALTSLNFPVLTNITGGIAFLTSTSLTSFTLPAILTIGAAISLTTLTSLTTFTMNSGLLAVNGNFVLTGAALTQASVDGILVSLANLDGTGGTTAYSSRTVTLTGGTSSTPSSTGLTAKATLVSRGCTVTTN